MINDSATHRPILLKLDMLMHYGPRD